MPFQLVYGLEATLLIGSKIPSLKLTVELLPNTTIEEERFLYLNKLDETQRDSALGNEAHKQIMKVQYDRTVQPRSFNEGDLVLTYDQKHDKLGAGKFESMWRWPYIVSHVLEKGHISWLIMMGDLWENPKMGSTSKNTMSRSYSIGSL